MKLFDNLSTTFYEKIKTIGLCYLISIIWIAIASVVMAHFQIPEDHYGFSTYPGPATFFWVCIFAPLWEELAFRYAPITIAKGFGTQYIPPVVVISSVLFGWGHGHGPYSLFIQGIGGLILSYLYIKNNYSYWSSVTLHFLINFSLGYIFPSLMS
jgi:membrane protease YdiL (CAAX protease family)